MTIKSYKLGPGTLKFNRPRTTAAVVTTVNTDTEITATQPTFLSGDVGAEIAGVGIPAATTITAVDGTGYSATLSQAANADGTVDVTITPVATGEQEDASCQVRECTVECTENVATVEAVPHLCGQDIPAEDEVTYTWRLKANLTQDLSQDGFTDFTWRNKGLEVWTEFVPNSVLGRTVSGPSRVVPLNVGGAAKTRPTHDIDWAMPKVEPALT